MAFIVHNLTTRTIILSDLRAEIGPQKMLDLEKVADRLRIDRSKDLRSALDTQKLRICSQGVLTKSVTPTVQTIEHHHHAQNLDEVKLADLMRRVIQEQSLSVNNVTNVQLLQILEALQKKLDTISTGEDTTDVPTMAPEKLAELQGKVIDKMSDNIETGIRKSGKKVILKNTKLGDLAHELGN